MFIWYVNNPTYRYLCHETYFFRLYYQIFIFNVHELTCKGLESYKVLPKIVIDIVLCIVINTTTHTSVIHDYPNTYSVFITLWIKKQIWFVTASNTEKQNNLLQLKMYNISVSMFCYSISLLLKSNSTENQ